MKKARYLLLRSPLLLGESLHSYLVRLANRNGYHTSNMVIQLCQERLSQPDIIARPTRAETYARLAELVKLDVDRLYAASAHALAITMLPAGIEPEFISLRSEVGVILLPSAVLQQHLWPETDAQFCPRCLAEATYHRLAWLPQAVSVCLVHRCLLVKGCPSCGARLKIADVVEGCCGQCDFDLRTSPTISVADDAFGLFSQHLIQVCLRLSTSTKVGSGGLPDQPGFILYQVMYGLHRAIRTIQRRWDYLHDPFDVDTAVSLFPCKNKTNMTPFKSYVLYATAVKGLVNWPYGFYDFLNAFKLRDQAEPTGTVADDLGCIYTSWLRNFWKQPEFSFLQMAFDKYLQENFAFALALQQKYRGSTTGFADAMGSDYISYHDAAQRLNTSVGIVERSVKLGLLANYPQSRKTSTTQRFRLASRDAVAALKQRWRYGIPLSDVARLLGVNHKITQDLMRAGLIRVVGGPEIDGDKVWKIGSQSLAYFFKRLERRGVRYLYDQPVKIISLTRAAEAGAKAGLDTIFLIEQILAGGLRGYWPPEHRNLGRLSVSVEDLKAIQDALQGDQPRLVGDNKDTEVAPILTEVEDQSRKIRLTASQLAQQWGISREYLWYWLKREIGASALEPENAENQT